MEEAKLDDFYIGNLGDSYTIMYAYLVRGLLDDFGIEGDKAAREGIRRFGRDRGTKRRENHLEAGFKINMKSLFSVGGDLPGDPRFQRDLQELNSEERISHTLVCPMSDVWKSIGEREIGRMYCEEFHYACYNSYAYGHTQVNLARTLTQNDDYCSFSIVLRPEFVPEDLKSVCFEEYDPLYVKPLEEPKVASAKGGFNSLCVRIFYFILEATVELLGEPGVESIKRSLQRLASNSIERMQKAAVESNMDCDNEFIYNNFPLSIDYNSDPLWAEYKNNDAKSLLEDNFYTIFFKGLGMTNE